MKRKLDSRLRVMKPGSTPMTAAGILHRRTHGIETSSSPCRTLASGWCIEGPDRGTHLVARLDYFQYEQKGPITRAQFLARARELANDKARELCDGPKPFSLNSPTLDTLSNSRLASYKL